MDERILNHEGEFAFKELTEVLERDFQGQSYPCDPRFRLAEEYKFVALRIAERREGKRPGRALCNDRAV